MGFKDLIFGDIPEDDLNRRLFLLASFLGSLTSLFFMILALFIVKTKIYVLITTVYFLIFAILFIGLKISYRPRLYGVVYILLGQGIIISLWYFLNGISGITTVHSLMFIVAYSLMMNGRRRFIAIVTTILNVAVLTFLEVYYPSLILLNDTEVILKRDFAISFVVISLVFFVGISYVFNAHQRQSNRLKKALEEIKQLQGILPICSHCKKIRDDDGYWNQIETYIQSHSDASFSHSICPDCAEELYGGKGWYNKDKDWKK